MNTLKIWILQFCNFLIPECFAVQLSNMVQSVQQGKDTYYLLLGHDDRSFGEAPTNSSGCIFLIIKLHSNCKLSSYKHLAVKREWKGLYDSLENYICPCKLASFFFTHLSLVKLLTEIIHLKAKNLDFQACKLKYTALEFCDRRGTPVPTAYYPSTSSHLCSSPFIFIYSELRNKISSIEWRILSTQYFLKSV